MKHILTMFFKIWALTFFLFSLVGIQGCASKIDRAMTGMLNQTDIDLVKTGIATPILLMDGLTEASGSNDNYKLIAAELNVAYGSLLLLDDKTDQAKMAFLKARNYGFDALALRNRVFKKYMDAPYDQFIQSYKKFKKKDVPYLYYTAQSWLLWIGASGSWQAAADVPKVESLLKLVLSLDETFNEGMAHAMLGVIYTSRPAALGGQPELAKSHFEKAIAIGQGQNLAAHVLYANHYCRLVYDRDCHDQLLNTVTNSDIAELPKKLKVINVIAQKQAASLLESANDYF